MLGEPNNVSKTILALFLDGGVRIDCRAMSHSDVSMRHVLHAKQGSASSGYALFSRDSRICGRRGAVAVQIGTDYAVESELRSASPGQWRL